MEPTTKFTLNGQQVITDDLNSIADAAGKADDRVLAELFRLLPYNGTSPSRGVLPSTNGPMVQPNGAAGSVLVQPFRAVVGPRTAVATDPKAAYRDIRSAISIGTTTLGQTVSLAANASGSPRWDLVYALVVVDSQLTPVIRRVKQPASKVIAGTNVSTQFGTTVTLGVVQGTPAASPVWPSAPADGPITGATGTFPGYYIPIAYVRVPNGFTSASTVGFYDIWTVAPTLPISGATGAASLSLASGNRASTLPTAKQQSYGATGIDPGNKTHTWATTAVQGSENLMVLIDTSTTGGVHVNGSILDTSRDWRNRYFVWKAIGTPGGSTNAFGHAALSAANNSGPSGVTFNFTGTANSVIIGGGNSFYTAGDTGGSNPGIGALTNANFGGAVAAGATVSLQVDSTTGNLKLATTGTPNAMVIFWLECSPKFY